MSASARTALVTAVVAAPAAPAAASATPADDLAQARERGAAQHALDDTFRVG